MVYSASGSENDPPLLALQVTAPLVINDNCYDVSSLHEMRPSISSSVSSSVGSSSQSFVSPDATPFEPNSFVTLHTQVYTSGQPNFLGARLSVPTSLNLPLWRSLLTEYSDVAVCDYLEFGWPISYDYHGVLPSSDFRNHEGALDFPCAIDSYLSTELALGSVCGPFARNPFVAPIALSPLNSVPKPDSDEHRFILDLSWPAGSSVNDGISKDFFGVTLCR